MLSIRTGPPESDHPEYYHQSVPDGTLTVSTTATVAITSTAMTGSPTVTTFLVPTSQDEENALAGIKATTAAFVNMVNQRGPNLVADDLLPFVDPDFLDNGMDGATWRTNIVKNVKGATLLISGLQITSLDTVQNVAEVSFQVAYGGSADTVKTTFRPVLGTWVISGNGRIAEVDVFTWALQHVHADVPSYTNSTQFIVYDIQADDGKNMQVQSVTVSGPGITGSLTVPKVCDNVKPPLPQIPECGNSHGSDRTQRSFEWSVASSWPAVGAQYVFELTTTGGTKQYTFTVGNEYGFDGANPVVADFPTVNLTRTPSLEDILSGSPVTITGTVYVPIWSAVENNQLHFNFMAPNGGTNDVTNVDTLGTFTGTPVPEQWNAFTMTIPAATIVSGPAACSAGGGTCYFITFGGKTNEEIEGGWFAFDANDHIGSFANGGVVVKHVGP